MAAGLLKEDIKDTDKLKLLNGSIYKDRAISLLRKELFALLFGGFGLLMGFISLVMVINIKAEEKIIPYVVSVDRQGSLINIGKVSADIKIPEKAVYATVCEFIEKLYSRYTDFELKKSAINFVFMHLDTAKDVKEEISNFYFEDEEKYKDVLKNRLVSVSSIVKIAEMTYKVEFETYFKGFTKENKTRYYATVSYRINSLEHTSLEELRSNPLGIFITELNVVKKEVSANG